MSVQYFMTIHLIVVKRYVSAEFKYYEHQKYNYHCNCILKRWISQNLGKLLEVPLEVSEKMCVTGHSSQGFNLAICILVRQGGSAHVTLEQI